MTGDEADIGGWPVSGRIRWLAAVGVGLVVASSGCGSAEGDPTGEGTGQQRPSIEVAEAEYTAMVERVREVLSAEHGVATWVQIDEPVTGFACDEVEGGAGVALDLGTGSPITEEDWPAALGAVQDIVGERGFTELDTVVDEPGDHLVRLAGPDGGYVDFGTREATILTLMTGCHPADASAAAGA